MKVKMWFDTRIGVILFMHLGAPSLIMKTKSLLYTSNISVFQIVMPKYACFVPHVCLNSPSFQALTPVMISHHKRIHCLFVIFISSMCKTTLQCSSMISFPTDELYGPMVIFTLKDWPESLFHKRYAYHNLP